MAKKPVTQEYTTKPKRWYDKGAGDAPSFTELPMAPVPANTTARWVQSFDPAATGSEAPPTVPGTGRGIPKRDVWPKSATDGNTNNPFDPKRLIEPNDLENMRADNQVLVRQTPDPTKQEKNAWGKRVGVYREEAGENLS